MKALRLLLGLLLAAYVLLLNLPLAVITLMVKAGASPGFMASQQAAAGAMPLWQLLLWMAGLVFYGVAAWRLLRGGAAFSPAAIGVALQIAMSAALILGRGSSAADASHNMADVVLTTVMAVVAGVIYLTERRAAGLRPA